MEGVAMGEKYVREHPAQSALTAIGVGFLLAQIPMRFIAVAFFRLILLILKPAALLYVVTNFLRDSRRSGDRDFPLRAHGPQEEQGRAGESKPHIPSKPETVEA